MNDFHPFLKFKANFDFESKSVEFLDTVVSITDLGYIKTTLFTKPGKKCTYLMPSSCHPSHICNNIPYSLALRLKRICSDETDFLSELDVLKDKLLSRGYRTKFILAAFDKVKVLDRTVALQKSVKKDVDRIVLSIPYDPRLPSVSSILYKFWKVMIENPRLKKIFPSPPMVCWTRPKNLREHLIRAKLPKEISLVKSNRERLGFTHCNRYCMMCKHSPKFAGSVMSSTTKEVFYITSKITCLSKNVIYCITCKQNRSCKSNPQYIGETSKRVCDRFIQHRSSVSVNDSKKPVASHFNQKGHSNCDLEMVPVEVVRSKDPFIRKVREKYYIRKFDPVLNIRV